MKVICIDNEYKAGSSYSVKNLKIGNIYEGYLETSKYKGNNRWVLRDYPYAYFYEYRFKEYIKHVIPNGVKTI